MQIVPRIVQLAREALQSATEFLRKVGYILRRGAHSQALADEMAFHREMTKRSGRPTVSFGNPSLLREQAREAWGWTWMDRLFQDLQNGAR